MAQAPSPSLADPLEHKVKRLVNLLQSHGLAFQFLEFLE